MANIFRGSRLVHPFSLMAVSIAFSLLCGPLIWNIKMRLFLWVGVPLELAHMTKYQYLEAQISEKFVAQNKVSEHVVFSLYFLIGRTTSSNCYHLLFCKSDLEENHRISPFDLGNQNL